jgi:hypothetical protein
LQLVDRTVQLFAERDLAKLVEQSFVQALTNAVIRCEIRRRLAVRLFPEGKRQYGELIRTRGAGSTKCGQAADRQWAESPSSLHGRPLRLSRMRRERGSADVVSPASSRFERTETEEQACGSSAWPAPTTPPWCR